MSIDTNPDLYNFAVAPNICNACYDIGKSPDSLFLCFAEIQRGDNFIPGDPEPPNGVWEIPATAACRWNAGIAGISYNYRMVGGSTQLNVDVIAGVPIFAKLIAALCETWLPNSILLPAGNEYYGGFCQVIPPLAGNSFSIADLQALLADDPVWAKWCNPIPTDSGPTVYKLYNARDHTNIHIKHESP